MKKISAEFIVLDDVEVPKTQIFRGSAPGPRWGGLQRPPRPPSCFTRELRSLDPRFARVVRVSLAARAHENSLREFYFSPVEPISLISTTVSLGCRHPIEEEIFNILEFGSLNMLTLRIGPFWVDEGFWKNFEIFSPGHARPCPCLYTAYIEPFICLAEKTK